MTTSHKNLVPTLLVFAISWLGFGCGASEPPKANSNGPTTAENASPKSVGNAATSLIVKNGYLNEQQYAIATAIYDRARKQGTITDQDLDFVIEQVNSLQSESSEPAYARMYVALGVTQASKFSDAQRERLVPITKKLITSSDLREQWAGIELASKLDDPQFVPDALPLLKASDKMPQVSKRAGEYLKRHNPD